VNPHSEPGNSDPGSSELLTPLAHTAQNNCFGCGPINPMGLHLSFSQKPDGSVVCDTQVSNNYEGPPSCLHGGIIATLLDEAMSKANRARGVVAMTRKMDVEYLRPVPSGKPIRIESAVTRSEGRKHWTEAHIHNADGELLAKASGFFITVKK
jgi:uncharacterized protein (TIGR00369 family)